MIYYIIVAVLIILTVLFGYGCYNLIKVNEKLEDELLQTYDRFEKLRKLALDTEIALKEADIRGSFESDDEVGSVFTNIKEISEELTKAVLDEYERGIN